MPEISAKKVLLKTAAVNTEFPGDNKIPRRRGIKYLVKLSEQII